MSACSSCGAQMRWALTDKGRRIPLDPEPVEGGNLVLVEMTDERIAVSDDMPTPVVRTLKKGEAWTGPRYQTHFVSCPNAATHRRKK